MRTQISAAGEMRIPRSLLKQIGLPGEVEIIAQGDCLVIRPSRKPRSGWNAAFERMREQYDDALLDGELISQTKWDADEWEWRSTKERRHNP